MPEWSSDRVDISGAVDYQFSINLFPFSREDNTEKGKRLLVVFELLSAADSQ